MWALVVLAAGGCGGEAPGERPQRVVVITLDTLRLDAFVGTLDVPTSMPRTRAWAEGGAVFQRYYSVSASTQPAHATLFSGRQPWEHGVTANGMVFSDAEETIVERLRDAGWATAAVVASGPLHASLGFDQGFEEYLHGFTIDPDSADAEHSFGRGDEITRLALEALDRLEGPRQFLWVHYFDPHAPYGDSVLSEQLDSKQMLSPMSLLVRIKNSEGDAEALLETSRGFYADDVRYMDDQVAALLARLDADGAEVDTHVVMVSDHGELFGEGGSVGHGKRLLPELLHVPLVVRSPRVEPGLRQEPVGSSDVAATIEELAGLEPRHGGESLVRPLDPGRRVFGMRRTFLETYEERRIDNTLHALEPYLFFVFDGKALLAGNGRAVYRGDGGGELPAGTRRDRLAARFAKFEAQVMELDVESVTDEGMLKALEQLGYTR